MSSPLSEFRQQRRAARTVPPRGLGVKPYEPKVARLDRQAADMRRRNQAKIRKQEQLNQHAAEMRQRNQANIRKRALALVCKRTPDGRRFAKREADMPEAP